MRDVEKEYRGKSAVHRKSLFLGKAHGFFDSECELLLHDCDVVIGRQIDAIEASMALR